MKVRINRFNPPQLHATPGYHHVTVDTVSRLAFLAGQCPLDAAGNVVGVGDLFAQVDQVTANSLIALSAVGAEPGDVVRSVIYVATNEQAVLAAAWRRFSQSLLATAFTTASTLIGVAVLGYPDQLVELDLTVALSPGPRSSQPTDSSGTGRDTDA